jgi:hypothetical protein
MQEPQWVADAVERNALDVELYYYARELERRQLLGLGFDAPHRTFLSGC